MKQQIQQKQKKKSKQLRIIKTPEPKKVQQVSTVGINPGICFRCKGKIYPYNNYLKLITMNNNKVYEEVWFHIIPNCWGDFNQDKINERMKQIARIGMTALQSRMNY